MLSMDAVARSRRLFKDAGDAIGARNLGPEPAVSDDYLCWTRGRESLHQSKLTMTMSKKE